MNITETIAKLRGQASSDLRPDGFTAGWKAALDELSKEIAAHAVNPAPPQALEAARAHAFGLMLSPEQTRALRAATPRWGGLNDRFNDRDRVIEVLFNAYEALAKERAEIAKEKALTIL